MAKNDAHDLRWLEVFWKKMGSPETGGQLFARAVEDKDFERSTRLYYGNDTDEAAARKRGHEAEAASRAVDLLRLYLNQPLLADGGKRHRVLTEMSAFRGANYLLAALMLCSGPALVDSSEDPEAWLFYWPLFGKTLIRFALPPENPVLPAALESRHFRWSDAHGCWEEGSHERGFDMSLLFASISKRLAGEKSMESEGPESETALHDTRDFRRFCSLEKDYQDIKAAAEEALGVVRERLARTVAGWPPSVGAVEIDFLMGKRENLREITIRPRVSDTANADETAPKLEAARRAFVIELTESLVRLKLREEEIKDASRGTHDPAS